MYRSKQVVDTSHGLFKLFLSTDCTSKSLARPTLSTCLARRRTTNTTIKRPYHKAAVSLASTRHTAHPICNFKTTTITTRSIRHRYTPPVQNTTRSNTPKLTHPYIHLRTAANDLPPPRPTKEVLHSLDPRVQALKVVYWPQRPDADPSEPGYTPPDPNAPKWPVCIVVNIKELEAAEAAKAEEKRRLNVRSKEMELNWAIDQGDLDTKMKQLRKFLEKGFRVAVMLLNKKKGVKKATQAEARGLVKRIEAVVAEVVGTKDYKIREGDLLQVMRLFLEGPPPAKDKNKKDWKKGKDVQVEPSQEDLVGDEEVKAGTG